MNISKKEFRFLSWIRCKQHEDRYSSNRYKFFGVGGGVVSLSAKHLYVHNSNQKETVMLALTLYREIIVKGFLSHYTPSSPLCTGESLHSPNFGSVHFECMAVWVRCFQFMFLQLCFMNVTKRLDDRSATILVLEYTCTLVHSENWSFRTGRVIIDSAAAKKQHKS